MICFRDGEAEIGGNQNFLEFIEEIGVYHLFPEEAFIHALGERFPGARQPLRQSPEHRHRFIRGRSRRAVLPPLLLNPGWRCGFEGLHRRDFLSSISIRGLVLVDLCFNFSLKRRLRLLQICLFLFSEPA